MQSYFFYLHAKKFFKFEFLLKFQVQCFLRNWGGSPKKFCKLKCPGNLKTAKPIKPINKWHPIAVCRCVTWPVNQKDRDGKCHWRIGNKSKIYTEYVILY